MAVSLVSGSGCAVQIRQEPPPFMSGLSQEMQQPDLQILFKGTTTTELQSLINSLDKSALITLQNDIVGTPFQYAVPSINSDERFDLATSLVVSNGKKIVIDGQGHKLSINAPVGILVENGSRLGLAHIELSSGRASEIQQDGEEDVYVFVTGSSSVEASFLSITGKGDKLGKAGATGTDKGLTGIYVLGEGSTAELNDSWFFQNSWDSITGKNGAHINIHNTHIIGVHPDIGAGLGIGLVNASARVDGDSEISYRDKCILAIDGSRFVMKGGKILAGWGDDASTHYAVVSVRSNVEVVDSNVYATDSLVRSIESELILTGNKFYYAPLVEEGGILPGWFTDDKTGEFAPFWLESGNIVQGNTFYLPPGYDPSRLLGSSWKDIPQLVSNGNKFEAFDWTKK